MLNVSTFLQRGQTYTISLQPSFFTPLDFSSFDSLTASVQGVNTMNGAYFHAGESGFLSNQVNCTFTYIGDGSDTVANLYQQIVDAMGSTFGSYSFVGATMDSSGVPETGGAKLPSLPSSSGLWAIALIALLAVFVLSGGATAIRSALA